MQMYFKDGEMGGGGGGGGGGRGARGAEPPILPHAHTVDLRLFGPLWSWEISRHPDK